MGVGRSGGVWHCRSSGQATTEWADQRSVVGSWPDRRSVGVALLETQQWRCTRAEWADQRSAGGSWPDRRSGGVALAETQAVMDEGRKVWRCAHARARACLCVRVCVCVCVIQVCLPWLTIRYMVHGGGRWCHDTYRVIGSRLTTFAGAQLRAKRWAQAVSAVPTYGSAGFRFVDSIFFCAVVLEKLT